MAIEQPAPLFDAPIPGMSLTHELGARPWQSPSQFTTVDEAIEFYMDRMATEEYMEQAVDVMKMGVPVHHCNSMQMLVSWKVNITLTLVCVIPLSWKCDADC